MKQACAILSSHYFPMQTGLGGYTTKLFRGLKDKGSYYLLSSKDLKKHHAFKDEVDVYPIMETWSFFELLKLKKFFKDRHITSLLIQYTPSLYGFKTLSFGMPFFIYWAKNIWGMKVEVMLHELYYPNLGTFKSFLLNFLHRLKLEVLSMGADKLYVSTHKFKHELEVVIGNSVPIEHLPVGSNIDVDINVDKESEKRRYGISKDHVIGLFGTNHPSQNMNLVIEALSKAKEECDFDVLYIGANADGVPPYDWFHQTGPLKEVDVSKALQICNLMVCYYVDGISSRRGSAIAALDHGIPLISTVGRNTESIFKDVEFIHLLSSEPQWFLRDFSKAIKNFDWIDSAPIKEFYMRNFCWKKTFDKLID